MKKRIPEPAHGLHGPAHNRPALATATGNLCPVSGLWVPHEGLTEPRHISQGSMMPAVSGTATVWLFVGAR